MTAAASPSILPPLSADELHHSQAVERMIRERIAQSGGWLSFEQFMDLVLYAPGLGYYSAGSAKLGASGDFITAPELSDSFSRCVANQCAEVLGANAGGEILEFGAGSGRMAATILESLAALGVMPERYRILEVSADLRERQRARVAQLPEALRSRVEWLDRLPDAPIQGVMLANEVLDALPCKRFVVRDGVARELGVSVDERGVLVEREMSTGVATPLAASADRHSDHRLADADAGAGAGADASASGNAHGDGKRDGRLARALPLGGFERGNELAMAYAHLAAELPQPLPNGYRSELCTRVSPWIAALADHLERGVALLFDYGLPRSHYYHPQRDRGTLRCHFKQRAHDDPFINLGVQDITAWVDFTAVAESAVDTGLDVLGFVTQAAFLLGTGIESPLSSDASTVSHARWAHEARQLLLPGEMGETFKVMALGKSFDAPLRGFALQDLRRLL
jgi:SAM-dependent MidA family methyltransferase